MPAITNGIIQMKNNDNRPSSVEPLSIDDFATFYEALYGHPPFKWQVRLAERACRAEWPDYIKLPTTSGKMAAIDIAVFALAFQAADTNRPDGVISAARRIFFVVDRRIIVNEAYRRTEWAAKLLRQAVDQNTESNNRDAARFEELDESHRNVLTRVAVWLQELAGDNLAPPLDCFELRGGIYRDDA
jgi:CRISPR-associated endonuclease/helicase Cas3